MNKVCQGFFFLVKVILVIKFYVKMNFEDSLQTNKYLSANNK